MLIKTSELIGPALDWAVAKCEEDAGNLSFSAYNGGLAYFKNQHLYCGEGWFTPSTNWSQGGPIIEREKLTVGWEESDQEWLARGMYCDWDTFSGPAPLIAAMCCFVASKLGDEVEIPEELL